jgi:aminoglycoside phosphotransferase family enzyme/predicted kinase
MSTITLIENLQNAKLYNHPIKYFKVIETHISWVILTGDYAYKIKKPLDLGFLNFTTLSDRKNYCEQELRLNQAAAQHLYLEVLPISGSETSPAFGDKNTVIEYALKMREFPQEFIFSNLLQKNELTAKNLIELAANVATFHTKISKNPPNNYLGTPEQVYEPVKQNFDQIHELLQNDADRDHLAKLAQWAECEYQRLYSLLQQRKQQQFIRECHGDIHLGNAAIINNKPTIFDCIEFNENFRWTDTMADVGFMIMDLQFNDRQDFANIFLNHYLIYSDDYAGLKVLMYYQAYRAMVRAKVKLFEKLHAQNPLDYDRIYQSYIKLAESYAKPQQPFLVITHGVSGSGKSTIARKLAEKYNMIHLISDIVRKKIAGHDLLNDTKAPLHEGIYQPEWTEKTYAQLETLTRTTLDAKFSVIVDATFLKKSQRDKFAAIAKEMQIPFCILSCHTAEEKVFERIAKREASQNDHSEAHQAVAEMQYATKDQLTDIEQTMSLSVDTDNPIEIDRCLTFFENYTGL